jgi:hypothetical protein
VLLSQYLPGETERITENFRIVSQPKSEPGTSQIEGHLLAVTQPVNFSAEAD